jgi:hypothetical protein
LLEAVEEEPAIFMNNWGFRVRVRVRVRAFLDGFETKCDQWSFF